MYHTSDKTEESKLNKENAFKVYVPVLASFDEYGNIMPVSFVWEDGHSYSIDRIIDKRPAYSPVAGGAGIRYTIRVRHRQTYMYLEEEHGKGGKTRWFMERKL
jgi:hypothetical protein